MRRRPRERRRSDLSSRQRVFVAAAGAVQLALLVAALADIWRRPDEQVNGSKPLWAAVSLVNFVGPLAYFSFGRRAARNP